MNLPKALVLTVAATTFCLMTSPAFAVENHAAEYDLSGIYGYEPKSMTPVAFWVVNRNTDFSGGDYVDWHEVETVSVPKMLQECHKNPPLNLAISARSSKITPASGRETRAAAVPLLIDTAFARQMAADKLRYKNAPIIAPPPAPAAESKGSPAHR